MRPGSKEWRRVITGSKIAAICGMSKWSSPIDIFCMMTGREVPSDGDDSISKPKRWGHRKERAIVESFCEDYGIRFWNKKRNVSFQHPSKPFACTPDYFDGFSSFEKDKFFDVAGFKDKQIYLEVKGLDAVRRYLYGDELSEEIDKEYYFQVQFGIGVVNAWLSANSLSVYDQKLKLDKVFFRVLFGAYDDIDYVVQKNDSFIKKIFTIGEDFLKNYVEKDKPPPPDASDSYRKFMISEFKFPNRDEKPMVDSRELLERLSPEGRKALLNSLEDYNSAINEMESCSLRVRRHKNTISDAIGENYGMITEIGKFLYYPMNGRVSDSKILKALIEEYNIPAEKIDKIREENRGEPTRVFRYYPSKDIKIEKERDEIF